MIISSKAFFIPDVQSLYLDSKSEIRGHLAMYP